MALAIVERDQPFPIPPAQLDGDRLTLIIPFVFQPQPSRYREEEAAVNAKMRGVCRGC
jgi:hypothetical protein